MFPKISVARELMQIVTTGRKEIELTKGLNIVLMLRIDIPFTFIISKSVDGISLHGKIVTRR